MKGIIPVNNDKNSNAFDNNNNKTKTERNVMGVNMPNSEEYSFERTANELIQACISLRKETKTLKSNQSFLESQIDSLYESPLNTKRQTFRQTFRQTTFRKVNSSLPSENSSKLPVILQTFTPQNNNSENSKKIINYVEILKSFNKKSHEIRRTLRKLVKEIYLQFFGTIKPVIPVISFSFYEEYFRLLGSVLESPALEDVNVFVDGTLTNIRVFGDILINRDLNCTLNQEQLNTHFQIAIKYFTKTFFKWGKNEYPKLEENSYYVMDPISRQAIRQANRAKFTLDFNRKFKLRGKQTLRTFIQSILENTEIFEDPPIAKDPKETHFSLAFELILAVLELGLLDTHDCDALLTTLDFFIEYPRNYFRKINKKKKKNSNFVDEKELENDETKNLIQFQMRYQVSCIILHILTVYSDEGFAKHFFNENSKNNTLLFVFENEYRFKGVMNIFTKFICSGSVDTQFADLILQTEYANWRDFQRNFVNIISFLNDAKFDLFMKSTDVLSLHYHNIDIMLGKYKQWNAYLPNELNQNQKRLNFCVQRLNFFVLKNGSAEINIEKYDDMVLILKTLFDQDRTTDENNNLDQLISLECILVQLERCADKYNLLQPADRSVVLIIINEVRKAGLLLDDTFRLYLFQSLNHLLKFFTTKERIVKEWFEALNWFKMESINWIDSQAILLEVHGPDPVKTFIYDIKQTLKICLNNYDTLFDLFVESQSSSWYQLYIQTLEQFRQQVLLTRNKSNLVEMKKQFIRDINSVIINVQMQKGLNQSNRNSPPAIDNNEDIQHPIRLETDNNSNLTSFLNTFITKISKKNIPQNQHLDRQIYQEFIQSADSIIDKLNAVSSYKKKLILKKNNFRIFEQLNIFRPEKLNQWKHELDNIVRSIKSENKEFRDVFKSLFKFLDEKMSINPELLHFLMVNNIPKQLLDNCIILYQKFDCIREDSPFKTTTKDIKRASCTFFGGVEKPPLEIMEKIKNIMAFVVLMMKKNIAVQKILFETKILDELSKFNIDSKNDDKTVPLKNYAIFCFFEPLLFAQFIFEVFKDDFEIFLFDTKCFHALLEYFTLVFNIYEQKIKTSTDHGASFQELEEAIQIWSYFLFHIFKEIVKRDNYSNGHVHFVMISNLLSEFLFNYIFEEFSDIGNKDDTIWEIPNINESIFSFASKSEFSRESIPPSNPEHKKSHKQRRKRTFLSLLKVFAMSITNFSNIKKVASILTFFKSKCGVIFGEEITKQDIHLRSELLKIYNRIMNFAKNNVFDEYVLQTSRPDMSVITDKFKIDDMMQIYSVSNIKFFINEVQQIVKAVRKLRHELIIVLRENASSTKEINLKTSLSNLSELNKYFGGTFLPAIHRLWKGIEVSYFTKIHTIDFEGFFYASSELERLVKISIFHFEAIYNHEVKNNRFDHEKLQIEFAQINMISLKGDPVATSIRKDRMVELNIKVKEGMRTIEEYYQTCFIFYHFRKNNLKDLSFEQNSHESFCWIPRIQAMHDLDQTISYYYNIVWRIKNLSDECVFDTIESFKEFYKISRPIVEWSKNKDFLQEIKVDVNKFLRRQKKTQNFAETPDFDLKNNENTLISLSDFQYTWEEEELLRIETLYQHKQTPITDDFTQYPELCRSVLKYYSEQKKLKENVKMKETAWSDLFTEDSSAPDDMILKLRTEKLENFKYFCEYLVGSHKLLNYFLDYDVDLSLAYFDLLFTQYTINWDYFMRQFPMIKDKCNIWIETLNKKENIVRRDFKYNVAITRNSTVQEDFYEIYFNLLNLMYWRVNDALFQFLIKQFNSLNQLIRLIKNHDSSRAIEKKIGIQLVENPIQQILYILKFLTENSRVHLNDGLILDFSDRKQDFPIYAVLLNNLTSLVKSLDGTNFNFDPIYITYLNNVITRRDLDINSSIYVLQYGGINALEAFLMKMDNSIVLKIWNNIDYERLYRHMIWLIKIWINPKSVLSRYMKMQKRIRFDMESRKKSEFERQSKRASLMNSDIFEAQNLKKSLYGKEITFDELHHKIDDLEKVFGKKGINGWFARNFTTTLDRDLDQILTDEFLKFNCNLLGFYSIRNMKEKYSIFDETKNDGGNYALSTAIGIYIFLKNLSGKIETIAKFMEGKEAEKKSALKKFDKIEFFTPLEKHLDDNQKAEYLVLDFMMSVVKRIEILQSSASPDGQTLLTNLYFSRPPISFLRSASLQAKIIMASPWENIEEQRFGLISSRDDWIRNLETYQDCWRTSKKRIIYFMIEPTWHDIWYKIYVITLVILNILMIIYLKSPIIGTTDFTYLDNNKWAVNGFSIAFIVTKGIHFFSTLCIFCYINASQIISDIEKEESLNAVEGMKKKKKTSWQKIKIWASNIWDFFYVEFSIFLFSFFGLFISEVFWTLCMLFVLLQSKPGSYIVKGVISDLSTMGELLLLLIITLVLSTFIIFQWFNIEQFATVYEICPNYLYCFVNVFTKGYRLGGGVGDFMENVVQGGTQFFWRYFFLVILFLLFVKQIMFNIFFGIIQDNFANARAVQDNQESRKNFCWICDIERFVIERQGGDFEKHNKSTHNPWNYQDYLFYLMKTPYIKLTEQDLQIKKKVDDLEMNWIPTKEYLSNPHEPQPSKNQSEKVEIVDDEDLYSDEDDGSLSGKEENYRDY